MISFLRQLRGGFASRAVGKFPISIALVGLRDLRVYLVHSKDGIPLDWVWQQAPLLQRLRNIGDQIFGIFQAH